MAAENCHCLGWLRVHKPLLLSNKEFSMVKSKIAYGSLGQIAKTRQDTGQTSIVDRGLHLLTFVILFIIIKFIIIIFIINNTRTPYVIIKAQYL